MSAAVPSGFSRYEAGDRVIAYAVLASIVLHGFLIFAIHLSPSKGRPAPLGPITAHLAAPLPVTPVAKPEPAKVEPQPKPVEEKPVPRVVKPAPVAKPSPIPVPKPAPAAPAPAPQAEAAKPQPAAPAVASSAPSQAATPAPSTAEVDARQTYRSELIEMAKKYKRYPRVAMDNNWEGRVVVRLVIGANGMIASAQVLTSAGYEVLDKQAQEMVKRAKTLVQIPAALRGKEFVIEIPVTYELKEAG